MFCLEPPPSWLWEYQKGFLLDLLGSRANVPPCVVLTAADSEQTQELAGKGPRRLTQMVLGLAGWLAVHNQVRELDSNGLVPLPVLHVVLLWR